MRLDFPDVHNGCFVELRDFSRLSWGKQKEIAVNASDEAVGSRLGVAEKIAIALVKAGYLLDADDKQIQFPLTEETVLDVPADVIEAIAKQYVDFKQAAAPKN